MIHVLLPQQGIFKDRSVTQAQLEEVKNKQNQIIKFVKEYVRDKNHPYHLKFCKLHLDDSDMEDVKPSDIILWHPNIAATNLDMVVSYKNSIVVLMSKTLFLRKLSIANPVNENMAVNHGFHVMYVDENYSDITNNEWKLVVDKESYLITHEQFTHIIEHSKS